MRKTRYFEGHQRRDNGGENRHNLLLEEGGKHAGWISWSKG